MVFKKVHRTLYFKIFLSASCYFELEFKKASLLHYEYYCEAVVKRTY